MSKVKEVLCVIKDIKTAKSMEYPRFEVTPTFREEVTARARAVLKRHFGDLSELEAHTAMQAIETEITLDLGRHSLLGDPLAFVETCSPFGEVELTPEAEEEMKKFRSWIVRQHPYFAKYADRDSAKHN